MFTVPHFGMEVLLRQDHSVSFGHFMSSRLMTVCKDMGGTMPISTGRETRTCTTRFANAYYEAYPRDHEKTLNDEDEDGS